LEGEEIPPFISSPPFCGGGSCLGGGGLRWGSLLRKGRIFSFPLFLHYVEVELLILRGRIKVGNLVSYVEIA